MIPSIQPIKQNAYTDKGNPYTESNIGGFAAGATIAGGAAIYGSAAAFKGAKKVFNKAKTIKLDIPKIKKPDFKAIKTPKSFKSMLKNIPDKIGTMFENAKNAGIDGFKYIKTNVKKINLQNIKKAASKTIDFVKTNAKKINKENIKKAADAVAEYAKKPAVKKSAGIAAAVAGIVAAGYAIDFVANKINAYRADKKA